MPVARPVVRPRLPWWQVGLTVVLAAGGYFAATQIRNELEIREHLRIPSTRPNEIAVPPPEQARLAGAGRRRTAPPGGRARARGRGAAERRRPDEPRGERAAGAGRLHPPGRVRRGGGDARQPAVHLARRRPEQGDPALHRYPRRDQRPLGGGRGGC